MVYNVCAMISNGKCLTYLEYDSKMLAFSFCWKFISFPIVVSIQKEFVLVKLVMKLRNDALTTSCVKGTFL